MNIGDCLIIQLFKHILYYSLYYFMIIVYFIIIVYILFVNIIYLFQSLNYISYNIRTFIFLTFKSFSFLAFIYFILNFIHLFHIKKKFIVSWKLIQTNLHYTNHEIINFLVNNENDNHFHPKINTNSHSKNRKSINKLLIFALISFIVNISNAEVFSILIKDKKYILDSDIKTYKNNVFCPSGYILSIPYNSDSKNAYLSLASTSGESIWLPVSISQPNAALFPLIYKPKWDGTDIEADPNWDSGEPNNGGGISYGIGSKEPCAIMKSNGKWNDIKCDELYPFICEKELYCNGLKYPDPNLCFGLYDCIETNVCYCGKGFYCSSTELHACPNGTFSEAGSQTINDCFDCGLYESCSNGIRKVCDSTVHYQTDILTSGNCRNCSEGYFIQPYRDDIQRCEICPLGFMCPGDTNKYKCTNGTYSSDEGQVSCTICPEGYFVTEDSFNCLPCSNDEQCIGDGNRENCILGYIENNLCYPCPDGYTCENGVALECINGTYIDQVNNKCLPCPTGKICNSVDILKKCENNNFAPLPGMLSCLSCEDGWYTDDRGYQCYPCNKGSECDGTYMTSCRENQYLSDNKCSDCTPGFYCDDYIKFSCQPGKYQNEGNQTYCIECPAGTYNAIDNGDSIDLCISCPPNTYSNNGSSTCINCPDGTFRTEDSITCQPCPQGTYITRSSNSLFCIPCPAGLTSYSGYSFCLPCPAGTNSSEGGECIICPAGTYSLKGSATCTLCPPGTYNEYEGGTSLESCTECEVGSSIEYGATDPSVCSTCFPGTYKVNTQCITCPNGTYSDSYDADFCIECPLGTFNNNNGSDSIESCVSCPVGTYSSNKGSFECIVCSAGTYKNESRSITPCEICSSGTFSPKKSSKCFECNIGEFSHEGSSSCTLCPIGTISNSVASKECNLCIPGTYQDQEGQSECKYCPTGTYYPDYGAYELSMCIKCKKGTYSNTIASATDKYCMSCPSGTFCDEEGLNKPRNCPKGTYSTISSSISVSDCKLCPPGTYNEIDGASSELFCISCQEAHYNPNSGSVSNISCISCPLGTYTLKDKLAVSLNDCIKCSPGTYSDIIGKPCVPCPIGTYNNEYGAFSEYQCIKCPLPSISKEGSSKETDCYTCKPGYYLNSKYDCVECPIGTYFNTTKLTTLDYPTHNDCLPCGQGYYQPYTGKYLISDCISCKPGTFAPLEINSECTPCGAGYYSSIEASESHNNCEPCSQGYWSSQEISNSSITCIPCVPGTYGNQTNAPSISYCLLCPIYTKSTLLAQSFCIECNDTLCSYPGSSFDFDSKQLSSELYIYDPQSKINYMLTGYSAMKIALPSSIVGLLCIMFALFLSVILILFRSYIFEFLKKVDLAFSMSRRPQIGKNSIKKPSIAGGITSLLVFIIFISVFTSILLDFIGNNKVLIDSTSLEFVQNIRGNFKISIIVLGNQEICEASFDLSGFISEKIEFQCSSGIHEGDTSQVEGCQCVWKCINCLPNGNAHILKLKFNGYILSPGIQFSIEVPHFIENEVYYSKGVISDIDSLFTGNKSEHQLSFKLKKTRYISISNFNAIYEAFGYQPIESMRQGYTLDLTSKVIGSIKPFDSFTVEEGLNLMIELDSEQGINTSKEYIKQNIFMFFAQIFTLISITLVIGGVIFNLLVNVEWLFKRIKNIKSKSKTSFTTDKVISF